MNKLFSVTYVITDRGTDYPEKEQEVKVPAGKTVTDCLKKDLNKYRRAMDLTTKFTFKIIRQHQTGWSNTKTEWTKWKR